MTIDTKYNTHQQKYTRSLFANTFDLELAKLKSSNKNNNLDTYLKNILNTVGMNDEEAKAYLSKSTKLDKLINDEKALEASLNLAKLADSTLKKAKEKYGENSKEYQHLQDLATIRISGISKAIQDYINMPEKIESLANEVIALSKDKYNKELFTQKSKELGALMNVGVGMADWGYALEATYFFLEAKEFINDLESDEIISNIQSLVSWGLKNQVLFGEEYSITLKDGTVLRAFNDYSYTEVIIEKNDEVLITNVENVKFETLMSLFDKKELSRKNEENKAMQELNNKASQFKNLANLSPTYLGDAEFKEDLRLHFDVLDKYLTQQVLE
ncbi:MAG TPA: hypothetical protein K8V51_00695 [Campylobacter avium]|uniref:hypothetical protein n=1 Tax=Campylobacter avium TaxID=522485 RepID=UPI001D79037B|nr:hypothetical protein [Campylobacter avium]HJE65565.1 hypothetical protein [Campylobacter avium]